MRIHSNLLNKNFYGKKKEKRLIQIPCGWGKKSNDYKKKKKNLVVWVCDSWVRTEALLRREVSLILSSSGELLKTIPTRGPFLRVAQPLFFFFFSIFFPIFSLFIANFIGVLFAFVFGWAETLLSGDSCLYQRSWVRSTIAVAFNSAWPACFFLLLFWFFWLLAKHASSPAKSGLGVGKSNQKSPWLCHFL